MSAAMTTLDFPAGRPDAYIRLADEPPFDARRHLALESPPAAVMLGDLGYDDSVIAACPSEVAITAPFRIFSDEGLEVIQSLAARIKSHRNDPGGTGKNRLGSYARGGGYRSRFIYDFCQCPELLDFLSAVAGARLLRHTVPAVVCQLNYAPDDVTRAIDTWHVDSVSFDSIILLTDPAAFRGGEFQYFRGTKDEGEQLLGMVGAGEGGTTNDLPPDRVVSMDFPAAGYGFLQQGNVVFHRACRLLERAERTTMLPSFVALPAEKDGTNVVSMSQWNDPGILTELARHEAWLAQARLQRLIDELPLDASPAQVAAAVAESAARLNRFADLVR